MILSMIFSMIFSMILSMNLSMNLCMNLCMNLSMNNLDVLPGKCLTRKEITDYCEAISQKIASYLITLTDEELLTFPADCEYTKFTLILAQFRHLHTHLGIIMGFIIDDTGLWPRVVGLENPIPGGEYSKYC